MLELQNFRGLDEQIMVDTSEEHPAYLLIGKNGSHIRLSPNAYHLLRSIYNGLSFEMLAERLSQRQGRRITPDEVEAAYQHITERIAEIEEPIFGEQFGFWLRFQCVPEAFVALIARPLSRVFHWVVAVFLLCGIIATTMLMLQRGLSLSFSPTTFWTAYGLFLVSLVFHEFGHASACVRYGARPSGIGFAIYWIYPAFYSDVSAAWELKRWQRVIVDLGGVFFQFIVGAGYIVLYLLSGWEPAHLAFSMILYSALFSLNPILRFDGYWVVADALGVTNLGQQPRRILRHFIGRLRRQPAKLLPWSARVTGVMICYTLISFGFWGYFTLKIIPFLWNAISNYPFHVVSLMNDLFNSDRTFLMESFQSFLTSTFTLLIAMLMLMNLSRILLKPLMSLTVRFIRNACGTTSTRSELP